MLTERESDALNALKELHWLLVDVRIKYKILCILFKCLHDKSSLAYLRDLLIHNNRNSGTISGLGLSDKPHLLIIPYVKYQTVAHRAFSVNRSWLWNSLPQKKFKKPKSLKHSKDSSKHIYFRLTLLINCVKFMIYIILIFVIIL